jgi:tetratricopeptide (TPR) repeat protein
MGLYGTVSRGFIRALVAGVASLAVVGCVREYVMIQTGIFPKPMLYEDSLAWTRQASDSIQTLHDYDTAKETAYGNMGQLEGLHLLVPDDPNGLVLLLRAWSGIAYGFMDDEREEALEKKDEALATYHEARARAAFKRARFYGEELVALRSDGWKAALRNADTLRAFLKDNYDDADDCEELLWLAFSVVGRINFDMDNPETVAELWIGIEILEHVNRLNPSYDNGNAYTMLGAAYAGLQDYGHSKEAFDKGQEISGGKLLTNNVTLAQRYYCPKRDKKNYFAALNSVLAAGDPLPDQRLTNTIAKRRAQRYLANSFWQQDCAFGG